MAESYSVEAYLKATGASQFANEFKNATKNVEGLERSTGQAGLTIGKLAAVVGITAAVAKGFSMIKNSVDGAISRYDTLNNFPKIMERLGFSTDKSQQSVQKLSEGIDGLPTTLDDVASTTQRIAILTGDLDGAVDTTLALNNAFIASGSDSGKASRGLEQYVQMLSKGSVDLQSWRTLQETMGLALNDTAKAFGFTGKSAQNDLYDALKKGDITFDQFNSKIIELSNKTGGFADIAKDASGGIRVAWTNMKTAVVKGVADTIGAIDKAFGGTGSIEDIIKNMKASIKAGFAQFNESIPSAIEKIKEIKAALEPWMPLITTVAGVIGSLVVAIASANTIMKITAGSMQLLSAVFTTTPIGAVIAGILLIVGAFTYLWKTNEDFRNFFINAWNEIQRVALSVWDSIKGYVMPTVDAIVSFVMSIWGQLVQFWQENGQMILQAAQNVWNVIVSVISTVMNVVWAVMKALWPVIKALIIDTWNAIKNVIQGAIDVILGIVKFFSALFTGNWSAMWDAVKQIFSGALQLVWGLINLWFVGKILKLGSTFVGLFRNIFSGMWNFIKSLFSNSVSGISNVISTGFSFINSIISTITNGIRSFLTGAWNGIVSSIRGAVGNVTSTISTGLNNALKFVIDIAKSFLNAGKNIVTSIADGIKSAIGSVTDAIGSVTQAVRNFLPFSPAKEGALRDIMDIQLAQSIAKAIDKGKNTAVRSMANLSDAINREMPVVDIAGQVAIASNSRGSINNSSSANRQGGITQNITINSPTPTSPSDNARLLKQVGRQQAMEWGF